MASRYIPDGQSVHIASRCFPRKRGLRSIKKLLLIGRIEPGERHARESQRLRSLYWGMQFALGALLPLAFWRLGADNFPAAVSLIVLLSFIFLTDLEAFIIPDHGSLGGTITWADVCRVGNSRIARFATGAAGRALRVRAYLQH